MLNESILYPVDHVPAIAYVPVKDPYGRRAGDPLFRSTRVNKKILDSDAIRAKATKLIHNSMVTVRDNNILNALLGVGVLSRHQLQRLFWEPDIALSTTNRRLKVLVERDILESTISYLDWLEDLRLERCSLYGIGDVGREILAVRWNQQSSKSVSYNKSYYSLIVENRIICHHVMTSEIYTQLKVKSNQAGNEMLWINEMDCIIRSTAEDAKELVRPDGYAEIWRDGCEDTAHLFIETDTRNTEWEKKIESYECAYAQGNWIEALNSPWFPIILCVVPTPQAVKRVGALIKERARNVTYLLKAWPYFLIEDPYTGWYHVQGNENEEVVKILPDMMIQEST